MLLKRLAEGFGHGRERLTDVAIAQLVPIGDEMRRIAGDASYIESVLSTGADQARELANPVLQEVKKIMGLL